MASWPGAPEDPDKGRSPNATGTFTFTGPDLTTSDTDSNFEYEVGISVYAEVPRNDTEDNMSSVTVIKMTRDADKDKVDDGWSVCWQIWETVEGSDGERDPGDCSVTLPDACRSQFMSSYDRPGECTLAKDQNGECFPPLGNSAAGSTWTPRGKPNQMYRETNMGFRPP